MRKIYSLITAVLLGSSLASNAANTTVTVSEEAVAHLENYRLAKLYDFVAWTYNGEELPEWKYSDTKASFKVNNWAASPTDVFQVTTEGLNNLYLQDTGGQYPRTLASEPGKACGIFNGSKGGRIFSIGDLKVGMIVVLQGGSNDASKPWSQTILTYEDNIYNLTDSIHSVQEALDNDGDGEADGINDGLRYYRIESDGRLDLSLERSNWIAAYAILINKDMAEYVETPVQKLTKVEHAYRKIEVKSYSSSFGTPVKTYYSIDGNSPINMRDTEVELSRDTTWVTNEETGEIVIDEATGEPMIDHIDITYVQEPVQDEAGEWGDWIYENEIEISDGDDEDGDGFITVKVASITDDGVMSGVSSLTYSVGDIVLNAPVLTLVGMNETARNYQLSWTNNTLCEEDYSFTYEANTGEVGEMVIGDIISLTDGVTVTVSAEGYSDGVFVMNEVAEQGRSYTRKNAELAAEGQHDWEFQNLPEDMIKKLEGKVVDYYYTLTYDENGEVTDTVKYDAEKIDNGEIDEPDNMETAYKYYGWNAPEVGNNYSRSTLHVIVDTLVNEETGEKTTNAYYDEEKTGIFNGLTVSCPPNAANNSCIFIYTNAELGAYFMSKSTISVENTAYGEFVVMGLGSGGSNFTNRTWSSCEMNEDPTGPYSVNLAAGMHVFYIDIYTSDDLPDTIEKVEGNNATFANVYSIDGRLVRANANVGNALNGLAKGIYIMNGKKYLVK
ncbi:MAG: hypothetical protein LUD00_06020 [Prevotellaceae bacterium]|nr:hypothetical protein [Prevotellaceae bacterium]